MARSRKVEPFRPTADMRVFLLHGREPFLMRERSKAIADTLAEAYGDIEQFEFDGASVDLAGLLDELRTYGLLQTHKLVILDRAEQFLSGDERRRRALESYTQAPVDHATLLLRAETWRAGNLDKHIRKVGLVLKVEGIDEGTAVRWCVARCQKRYDSTIDPAAAQALVGQIGADLDRLDSELGKLSSYAGADRPIGTADVAELVGLSREQQAWVIQSAIASGDGATAIRTLRELLTISRQPEQLITWAVTDFLRKLHGASRRLEQGMPAGEVARDLRLWGPERDAILKIARDFAPSASRNSYGPRSRPTGVPREASGRPRAVLKLLPSS